MARLFSYSGRINRMEFFLFGCVTPLLVLGAFAAWAVWMFAHHFRAAELRPWAIVSDSLWVLAGFVVVMAVNGTITWAAVFKRARDIDGTTLHAKIYLALTIIHPILTYMTYGSGPGGSLLMLIVSLAGLGYIGFFLFRRGMGEFDFRTAELAAFGDLPAQTAIPSTGTTNGQARLEAALQSRLKERATVSVRKPAPARVAPAAIAGSPMRARSAGAPAFGRR